MKSLTALFVFLAAPCVWGDEFFSRKIEPILRQRCFQCHSHAHDIEAGLALDSRSGWEQGGDSGAAILPGKPNASLLIKSVRWSDGEHQMPPDEKLSDEEISLLEEWVQRGAPDPRKLPVSKSDRLDWWSLRPLAPIAKPNSEHPIDGFVDAKLVEQGLRFSPEADRRTLIRRLYLDLHGLLPTPEAVDAFVDDTDPLAYEKLVDRLLESPRYGERWARHWLDVVHFADSHGCEHDVKRPNAFRYRDYVIERLNADVPWARFIREQLAPDMFYPNEPRLMAGLGYVAAGPLELSRAGTAPVTFDYLDRDDMVTQTMAAFASTTANCARCHTHKFDPITQEDYYALQAVFAGIGKGDIEFERNASVMRRRIELQQLLFAAQEKDASVLLHEKYAKFVLDWENARSNETAQWTPLNPVVFIATGGSTMTKQPDGSIFASGHLADQEQYTVTTQIDLKRLTALRLEVLKDDRLPKGGPGRAGNGNLHLTEVDLHWFPTGAKEAVKLKVLRTSSDFDQDGWTSAQSIDGDLKSGWAIFPRVNESHHIVFELADSIERAKGGRLAITMKQLWPPKHFIGRFRLSATDAACEVARVLPKEASSGLKKPASDRTKVQAAAIAAIALEEFATDELSKLPARQVVYGVSASWSHAKKLPKPQSPKVVHLLRRGDIDKPIREVGPGALSALSELGLTARFDLTDSGNESLRRAALAGWLADKKNPLTWRSAVNRVWHYHFGRGLSDTPNDFGRMGSQPSHPELLDWLAIWFRDHSNGSLKELHKLILTSRTWRQSSQVGTNSAESDNRLLGRMNRQRLDADAFRDSVLQISGRLDLSMGGPGIEQFKKTKGPQATPALDYSAFDWNSDEAARRSIYRVVWRGIPDPFMDSLDFPDTALLTPTRGVSVSALQSLTQFNNDFVLQASEWISERIAEEVEETNHVRRAVHLCWQRQPTKKELNSMEEYLRCHGLAALCRVLLNSNEFMFID